LHNLHEKDVENFDDNTCRPSREQHHHHHQPVEHQLEDEKVKIQITNDSNDQSQIESAIVTAADDDLSLQSSSNGFYRLNKSSKRWRSMYALRDSIRNLTSCVSTKSNFINK
jgi:hypothetical protein